jgi:hypothetical protein
MNRIESVLVYLFTNQYCESDFAYIILLLIIIYVSWTFMEGIIPETREIMYQRELTCEHDPNQSGGSQAAS